MSQSSIATDIHQSLDIQLDFRAQLAFDLVLVLDHATNRTSLVIGPLIGTHVRVDTEFFQYLYSSGASNSKDGRKRDLAALCIWNVNSSDSWHCFFFFAGPDGLTTASPVWQCIRTQTILPLALLVFRILFVDHINATFPTDNLVV